MSELKECPYCGSPVGIGGIYEHDERRYMRITVECCAEMHYSIPYNVYRKMTLAEQEAALIAGITELWNTRYEPDQEGE